MSGGQGQRRFVTGTNADGATLWAGVDPTVHHIEGRVAERRFGAFLAPFRTIEAAEAALIAAGATVGPTAVQQSHRSSIPQHRERKHG